LPRSYETHEWVTVQTVYHTYDNHFATVKIFFFTPCFLFTEFKISVLTSCSYTVNLEISMDFNCVTKYQKRRPKRVRSLSKKDTSSD
jgi:hypothetical protein